MAGSLALVGGCGGGGALDAGVDPALFTVDDYCPGQAACSGIGDDVLRVGAARQVINPTLVETEWMDLDGDGKWSPGEQHTDVNGNGEFDAVWIAGKTPGRPARGFLDDLEVRAIVLERNDVAVAIVYLDLVGYFVGDVDAIRDHPDLADLPIDHVLVGSTHTHAGPDTLGIFGATAFESGVDPDYMAMTHQRAAAAIRAAFAARRPATMEWAKGLTLDGNGTTTADWVADTREPVIYDPTLTVLRFADVVDDQTIATVVNWSAHPEDNPPSNQLLSADYVHYLRARLEALIGGTTVFVQGAAGGQIGPGGIHPPDQDGVPVTDRGDAMAKAQGENLAELAATLLVDAAPVATPAIAFRTARIYAIVENKAYQLAFVIGMFARNIHFYDPELPFDVDNLPWLDSRVTYLQIGPVAMVSCPGELHPELWIGGYDGSWSWGRAISTQTVNAPDLSTAPAPPYLIDLVKQNPGVEHAFVAGYAEDFVGYIVPAYNYVLDDRNPYFEEAEGDHYEEISSIGPRVEEMIWQPMARITTWRPPGN